MATYTGICFTDVGTPPVEFLGAALADPVLVLPLSAGIDDVGQPIAGVWTDGFPLAMPEEQHEAAYMPGFVDDFYFRIWVFPSSYDEFVLADVECPFTLWNAFFTTVVCTDVDVTNESEIDLPFETGEPLFVLYALHTKDFTATIHEEGAAEFTSILTFDFVDVYAYLSITGLRLLVFGYEPLLNAAEILTYHTDIQEGVTGIEQRMSLANAPGQQFDIQCYLPTEQVQSRFEARLHTWQKRGWGLPIWSQHTVITNDLTEGAEEILFDTSYADYRDGGLALVWQSVEETEVILIETVESDRLVLRSALSQTWTGKKWIMPLRVAYMVPLLKRPSAVGGSGSPSISFVVKDIAAISGYVADQEHNGIPILLNATLLESDAADIQSDSGVVFTDYGSGAYEIINDREFVRTTQPLKLRNVGREACWKFRQFLDYVSGSRRPFYVPTFKEDLVLSASVSADSVAIRIEAIELYRNLGVNDLRNVIGFLFSDGSLLTRDIDNIVLDGDEEIITIDANLGVAFDPEDCEVCFLDLVRISEDKVKLLWEEPDQNLCSAMVTRVKA